MSEERIIALEEVQETVSNVLANILERLERLEEAHKRGNTPSNKEPQ